MAVTDGVDSAGICDIADYPAEVIAFRVRIRRDRDILDGTSGDRGASDQIADDSADSTLVCTDGTVLDKAVRGFCISVQSSDKNTGMLIADNCSITDLDIFHFSGFYQAEDTLPVTFSRRCGYFKVGKSLSVTVIHATERLIQCSDRRDFPIIEIDIGRLDVVGAGRTEECAVFSNKAERAVGGVVGHCSGNCHKFILVGDYVGMLFRAVTAAEESDIERQMTKIVAGI